MSQQKLIRALRHSKWIEEIRTELAKKPENVNMGNGLPIAICMARSEDSFLDIHMLIAEFNAIVNLTHIRLACMMGDVFLTTRLLDAFTGNFEILEDIAMISFLKQIKIHKEFAKGRPAIEHSYSLFKMAEKLKHIYSSELEQTKSYIMTNKY